MSAESTEIVGNFYDKYSSTNPIERRLLDGFLEVITELYHDRSPRTVLEVGCGEGHLATHLIRSGHRPEIFVACDLSLDTLDQNVDSGIDLLEASVYDLPFESDGFDMVVCCEVLEHLEDPGAGLSELARVSGDSVLLSTPWEPVWRALNIARGKYLRNLGNTPGHKQHFTRRSLLRFVGQELQVVAFRRPLPWTVLLGTP